ncbi:unnamed protein product, partial [Rotaria magnacalcarata]
TSTLFILIDNDNGGGGDGDARISIIPSSRIILNAAYSTARLTCSL